MCTALLPLGVKPIAVTKYINISISILLHYNCNPTISTTTTTQALQSFLPLYINIPIFSHDSTAASNFDYVLLTFFSHCNLTSNTHFYILLLYLYLIFNVYYFTSGYILFHTQTFITYKFFSPLFRIGILQ